MPESTERPAAAFEAPLTAHAGAGSRGPAAARPETRGTDRASAAAAAAEEEPAARLIGARRSAERSALYHKMREGFLGACHRAVMFLVLVASSAAVAALVRDWPRVAPWLAALPAVLGALDMVFAFARSAGEHSVLARRFLDVAADATTRDAVEHVGELEARLYRLYAEEPPTFKALDALCDNQICDSVGDNRPRLRVRLHQRMLRHVVRFSGTRFLPEAAEEPE